MVKRVVNPLYQTGARVQFIAGGRLRGQFGTVTHTLHLAQGVRVFVQFDGKTCETDCHETALTLAA